MERLSAEHAKNLATLERAESLLQTERSQREALHEERERVASRIATVLHGEGAGAYIVVMSLRQHLTPPGPQLLPTTGWQRSRSG